MKAALASVLFTISAAWALPVCAETSDLPLEPDFAAAVVNYRDCVIGEVDRMALTDPRSMAMEALATCAVTREQASAQLLSDIQAQSPDTPLTYATQQAENGMASVDPMIAQAAIDQARMHYAVHMQ